MAKMTPRERVRMALDHREPDRVPMALGGGPYGIADDLYLKLVNFFDLGDPVPPFRKGHSISYMDDRVLEKLGVDTRYVWPGASPSSPIYPTDKPDIFLDGYGQPWKYLAPYYHPDKGLLADASIEEIESRVKWPDLSNPRWYDGVRERAKALSEETDYFVIARMATSHGPYMTASHLRGVEQFFLDMAMDEEFTLALVERVTDTIDGLLRVYLEAGGDYFDMIELSGDDYATQTGMAMSPKMFRSYFKPSIKRFVNTIKSFNSEIKVMLHCDGDLTAILPDIIECGVDVLHPLEPVPSVDFAEIKANFGDALAFLGAIDIVHALPGSHQDVIDEVKRRIHQLAFGGGFVIAPANHVQSDVPPENLVTLFNAAEEHGRYPIQL